MSWRIWRRRPQEPLDPLVRDHATEEDESGRAVPGRLDVGSRVGAGRWSTSMPSAG